MLEQRSTDTGQQNIVEQGTLFDKAELERLKVERRHWEDTSVRESQERMPECDNLMTTSSVPVNRVYTPQDGENLDYMRDLGLPGEYPYTRGVQPTMYRAKPWTMRMFAGFGTAEDTNARFKYLLSQGQTGLSTAFDMPTLYMPRWNTISISGYHIREAGATAVQELAFTIADGLAYVDATLKRGLKIDEFAPRLSFFFDVHNDFFEEIAKFRAGRRLWARLMRERYGAKDPRSWLMRCHAQTAGVSLTAQQPDNNIIRTTIQALA